GGADVGRRAGVAGMREPAGVLAGITWPNEGGRNRRQDDNEAQDDGVVPSHGTSPPPGGRWQSPAAVGAVPRRGRADRPVDNAAAERKQSIEGPAGPNKGRRPPLASPILGGVAKLSWSWSRDR